MLNNYKYFLVLAEELNISKAAERLYVSHQSLSKYLKKMESEYGVVLFNRSPSFSLTYAGRLMLDAFRRIELIDKNLSSQIATLHDGQSGEVRVGTTEGRMRLLMPDLLDRFKREFPDVELCIICGTTASLLKMLSENKLDIAIMNDNSNHLPNMKYVEVLKEHLYVVISNNMLSKYFPDAYPACRKKLLLGADLRDFAEVPFVLNHPGFTSRGMIDRHLMKIGASLKCVNETSAMDLQYLMTGRDYAASFAFSMYLPSIRRLSNTGESYSEMNIFPIKDMAETNSVVMIYPKESISRPKYADFVTRLLRELCGNYADEQQNCPHA